jgi:hypothetical protein
MAGQGEADATREAQEDEEGAEAVTGTPPQNTTDRATEFQIAEEVAQLIDGLHPDKRKQVMAMLATRYGLAVKEPSAASPAGRYRSTPKRRSW